MDIGLLISLSLLISGVETPLTNGEIECLDENRSRSCWSNEGSTFAGLASLSFFLFLGMGLSAAEGGIVDIPGERLILIEDGDSTGTGEGTLLIEEIGGSLPSIFIDLVAVLGCYKRQPKDPYASTYIIEFNTPPCDEPPSPESAVADIDAIISFISPIGQNQ